MEHLIGQYYGMDWLAMILSLATIYILGDKKRYGFLIGIGAALSWIFVNLWAGIWPGVLLNVVLIGFYGRGYIKWSKDKNKNYDESKK